MALILDGKKVQTDVADRLRIRIGKLSKPPTLVILSQEPGAESLLYIKKKKEFGESLGCTVEHLELEKSASVEEIKNKIEDKNKDNSVDGVMVQLPFDSHYGVSEIIDSIDPLKDVDGLTSSNATALFRGEERILPATTRGILEMLSYYNLPLRGKKVVIVGRSSLVGRPTALAFTNRDATVTLCHSKTSNLAEEVLSAEVVVSATGVAGLVSSRMMHSRQIVLDVGISVDEEGKTRGDVDLAVALDKVKAVSPVPGGLGPLTVTSLFLNLVDIAERLEFGLEGNF